MAYIKFKCGECRKTLKIGDRHGGEEGECPNCGAHVVVPDVAAELSRQVEPREPVEASAASGSRATAVRGGDGRG